MLIYPLWFPLLLLRIFLVFFLGGFFFSLMILVLCSYTPKFWVPISFYLSCLGYFVHFETMQIPGFHKCRKFTTTLFLNIAFLPVFLFYSSGIPISYILLFHAILLISLYFSISLFYFSLFYFFATFWVTYSSVSFSSLIILSTV